MARRRADQLAVILLPDHRHEELLALASEWTQSWLIQPAIWLHSADVRSSTRMEATLDEERPPAIRGTLLGRNGMREVDLFAELGMHDLAILRLVAVRVVSDGVGVEVLQDRALDVVSKYVGISCPDTTKFVQVNVVCSPTQIMGGDREALLEYGWHANVIASPEDRRTALTFDAFTRPDDAPRFDGFVMSHAATVGGLWSGVRRGPYDDFEPTATVTDLQVQRVSVRGVISDGLLLGLSRAAVESCAGGKSPLAEALTSVHLPDLEPIPDTDVDRAVKAMVDVAMNLDDRELSFRGVEWRATPAKRKVTFWQSVRQFFAFSRDRLRNVPGMWADDVRGSAARKSSRVLHGSDGDAEVVARKSRSSLDEIFVRQLTQIASDRVTIVAQLSSPILPGRSDIHASLWGGLRKAVFASLDGSEWPGGERPEPFVSGAKVRVFADTEAVMPDWRDSWTIPPWLRVTGRSAADTSAEVPWLDVSRAEDVLEAVEKRYELLEGRQEELEARLRETMSDLEATALAVQDSELELSDLMERMEWIEADMALEAEMAEGYIS